MSQLSLFTPVPCPCGESPAIREDEDGVAIIAWCLCETIWTAFAKTLPEALTAWAGLMEGKV